MKLKEKMNGFSKTFLLLISEEDLMSLLLWIFNSKLCMQVAIGVGTDSTGPNPEIGLDHIGVLGPNLGEESQDTVPNHPGGGGRRVKKPSLSPIPNCP